MTKAVVIGVAFSVMMFFGGTAQACACGGDPYELPTQWNKLSDESHWTVYSYGHLPTPPPGYMYAEDLSMIPAELPCYLDPACSSSNAETQSEYTGG